MMAGDGQGRSDGALEAQVASAVGGSREALAAVVAAVQHEVYGLSLRMLWHPDDAADATQEILIKVVTSLSSFRGESSFRTWCYRVACNHLSTTRKSRIERRAVSFEALASTFDSREPEADARADDALGEEEVKLGCTLGILMCLDRDHRLAYIVGEILALTGDEGARVTEVDGATYRKRLSRARTRIRGFFEGHCGLVNAEARCRCAHRVAPWTVPSELGPGARLFTSHRKLPVVREALRELTELHGAVALYRSHPSYAAPEALTARLREIVSAGGLGLLGHSRVGP